MTLITLRRAKDGITRELRLSPWLKAIELSPKELSMAWAGIQQTSPDMAKAMKTDPLTQALIAQFQATPVFTEDAFSALMRAGQQAPQDTDPS